jgi:hypothetical protein
MDMFLCIMGWFELTRMNKAHCGHRSLQKVEYSWVGSDGRRGYTLRLRIDIGDGSAISFP